MAAGVVLNRRCASMLVAATLAMCPWLTDAARAQSTWLPTSGTTPWTTTTAWSNDLVPNGIGAGAVFPTATVTALLDDTTVTLGTINQTTASGNVVIGSTGTAGSSTDWINLEAASGVPVINVTGGNLYMYAQLTGSQGLSKTGGGVYSPRYNSLDFTYTGTNYFSGGTVQIARDGQLGDAANPIEVLGSTVLQSWSFPTTTWSTTRPITISTGLLTIQNGTAANTAALGGAIAGSGSLTLNTGNFLIGGPTSYTGATTIRSATVSLSGGAILSSAPLSLQTSAANTGGSLVDFGGGSQTVANLALTLASGGTAQAVNTFRNGSLTVTGGNLNVNSGASSAQSGTTQLDLKGLSAFSWGNGAGNLVLNTTSTVSSSTTATIMSLPTSGSASLSAAHVQIANSSNGPASSTSTLSLGLANSISTGTLTVGAYRGNGIMAFAPDVSGGSLVLRGPAGGESRVDHVYIGFKSGGDNFGNGSIDVASGSIDARVANFTVGLYYANASNTQSSTFTMTSGTVDITTLSLGVVSVPSGTAGTPVMNDLFNQSGGTVRAESLVFGANSATFGSNNPSFRGTYTLAGGTFAAGSVSSGTGVSAATSQRRFTWSGGTLTTLSGSTDLTMTGASGSGGAILFTVSGSNAKTFDVPAGRTATIGDFVTLSGSDTGFTKSGGGRLVIGGASGFTSTLSGSASVQGGTLRLATASALASATLVPLAGGTAQVAPYVIASVAALNLSGTGLVDVTNGGLTVTSGLSAADLVAALIAGRNGGTWDGTSGITSSVTAAQVANFEMRAVGWLDNGDGSMTTAYAAQGDTNLDWVVDILDVSNFVASGKFGTGAAATWSEGDFNYDGVVDIQDVADFSATGLYGGANYNTPPGSAISAVPEPTLSAAALVAVAGWWATKRRR